MDTFGHDLTLTLPGAAAVVLTTAVMYALLVTLLRVWGARLFANPSAHTWGAATILGAIVARTSLGLDPTLSAGILALGTVFVMMFVLRRVAMGRPGAAATALVVDGVVQTEALTRARLSEATLWHSLRQSGRASLDDVALVVLEPSGRLSVIARGSRIDPRAVADVGGAAAG